MDSVADLELHLGALAQHVTRFESVSARLPPVSRWIASVMQKNWNSAVPMRSATSSSAISIVLPILMRSETPLNSMPTGSGTSLATIPSVSEIGKPERRPRTISSIASGNLALKLFMRFLIWLPTTRCGSRGHDCRTCEQAKQNRCALDQGEQRDLIPDAGHHIFRKRPVFPRLLQAFCE